MRALKLFAPLALSLLGVTACLDTVNPARDRIGLVTVRAFSNVGTPVLRGTATFYRVAGLTLPPLQVEPCGVYAYNPNVVGVQVETLEAGNVLTFSVGGSSLGADRQQISSFIRYEMPQSQFLTFTAGDTVTVSIPGAVGGFEPTLIKVRAAEPFTADTLPTFVTGQPFSLSWSSAPAAGSFMVASLRFNVDGSSSTPNVEIACVFEDDGSGEIPTNLAQSWGSSQEVSRSYQFTRIRESFVSFDSRTRTRVRSLYDVPTPPLAAAPTLRTQ